MADPRYGAEYQRIRRAVADYVATGQALCMQTDPHDPASEPGSGCVMPSRELDPRTSFDLAHDADGDRVIGPAHPRCNRRDGGVRRHRPKAARRWLL